MFTTSCLHRSNTVFTHRTRLLDPCGPVFCSLYSAHTAQTLVGGFLKPPGCCLGRTYGTRTRTYDKTKPQLTHRRHFNRSHHHVILSSAYRTCYKCPMSRCCCIHHKWVHVHAYCMYIVCLTVQALVGMSTVSRSVCMLICSDGLCILYRGALYLAKCHHQRSLTLTPRTLTLTPLTLIPVSFP